MSSPSTWPIITVIDYLEKPRWNEPDTKSVGTVAAMKSLLDWARRESDWFHAADVTDICGQTGMKLREMAAADFSHTIEMILNRWRCWFPDDAPPDLPDRVRYGTEAHRVVDAAQRCFEEMNRRYEARWAQLRDINLRVQTDKLASSKEHEQADEPAFLTPMEKLKTIWSHGEKSYSTDGSTPKTVSREADNILFAFAKYKRSMQTRELEQTGTGNVTRAMDAIEARFPGSIRWPDNKGEGYFIDVRSAVPKK